MSSHSGIFSPNQLILNRAGATYTIDKIKTQQIYSTQIQNAQLVAIDVSVYDVLDAMTKTSNITLIEDACAIDEITIQNVRCRLLHLLRKSWS